MYYRGYRTLDREYADSTGLVARASIYDYRMSGPPFRRFPVSGSNTKKTSRPAAAWADPSAWIVYDDT